MACEPVLRPLPRSWGARTGTGLAEGGTTSSMLKPDSVP